METLAFLKSHPVCTGRQMELVHKIEFCHNKIIFVEQNYVYDYFNFVMTKFKIEIVYKILIKLVSILWFCNVKFVWRQKSKFNTKVNFVCKLVYRILCVYACKWILSSSHHDFVRKPPIGYNICGSCRFPITSCMGISYDWCAILQK